MNQQEVSAKPSLLTRMCSNPRVQRCMNKSKRVMGSVAEKYNHGVSVSKDNAKDTLKEMAKFFSATEAKAALGYTKNLAKETHEELVGSKVRLLSNSVQSIFQSQILSMWNRNYFAIDNSAEDDTEEQD